MLRLPDKILSWLLVLLSAGHTLGTFMTGSIDDSATVWSFSGSLAAWMIAGVNLLRVGRQDDRPLALLALVSSVSWIGLMLWLAHAAEMWADIRIWLFAGVAAGLAIASLLQLTRARGTQA